MAKNFQLVHIVSKNKSHFTNVYTAVSVSNREYYTIKIADLDDLTDPDIILVSHQKFFNKNC